MVMLATAEELASYLKQSVDTATAEQAITFASARVETLTGMAFTERTAQVSLPAHGGQYLTIPLRPVREVTLASIGGATVADFTLTHAGLYRAYGWQVSWTPQQVDLTVEYGTSSVPDDIKALVLEMAGFAYDSRDGVSSEAVDDYRVSYTGQMSASSRSTLAAYGADAGTIYMITR